MSGSQSAIRTFTRKTDPEPDSFLSIRSFTFSYPGTSVPVLAGIDLDVRQGEFVSILGRSGCGKTTMLRACAGFLFPDEGTVECAGERITGLNRHAGYVTQATQLYEWMSVRSNLDFPMRVRGIDPKARTERIESWIDSSGLRGYGNSYPSELSGGMQKRVAIGQVACFSPKLLLLDEPFIGLDAFTKLSVQGELARVWSEYLPAALLVTHDITEAIGMSDRIIVLADRPAHVASTIHVDIERPRDLDLLQTDERFLDYLRQIHGILGPEQASITGQRKVQLSLSSASSEQPDIGPGHDNRPGVAYQNALGSAAGNKAGGRRMPVARGQNLLAILMSKSARQWAYRLLIIVALLGLWQLFTSIGTLDPVLFSSPTSIAAEFFQLFAHGQRTGNGGPTIYNDIAVTMMEWGIGYLLGCVGGILCGMVLGRWKAANDLLQPFFLAGEGVPKIAIAPLFVLVFGLGVSSKVSISALTAFFLVFFQVYAGVSSVSEERIRLTRLIGASRTATFLKVILPASSRSIFVGLQVAVPMAMTGAIVGEFIASSSGLGWFLNNSAATFDASGVFAGVLIIVILIMLLSGIISIIQKRVISWPED